MQSWLEIGKLAASVATPIVVAILGVLLLRRIEGVKALVGKQSDFHKKWADEFFTCCQQFMQALERDLALLTTLGGLNDPNGKLGDEIKEEVYRLNAKLSELELRIRRSVVFAPISGGAVSRAANECVVLTAQLLKTLRGNLDEIIGKMNDFNLASRKAHAEMLGLGGYAEQSAPEGRSAGKSATRPRAPR
ncbi:MAG: hypothetical protein QM533_08425 [Cytophagales bacterium]|nr:hypothetical protein [Cytophagales bacterium]